MKKTLARILCILVILVLVLSLPVYAAFTDFPDAQDHWGAEYLEKAYDDGILIGYEDNTMRPDKEIDTCEVMTVLTRVLDMNVGAVSDELGLTGDEWYAEEVSAAYEMGLFEKGTDLESGIKRQDAFYALAEAFCLIRAEPDPACMAEFTDANQITEKNMAAMISLVQDGYVIGFAGSLTPNSFISRAEFVTILYRIVERAEYSGSEKNFVSKNGTLKNITAENIWLACSTSKLYLSNVRADFIAIRSDNISSSYMSRVYADRLAIASSGEYTFSGSGSIDTVSVCSAGGKVKISQRTNVVEIVSSGREIEITVNSGKVIISGNNNTVTVSNSQVGEIILAGEGNKLVVNRNVSSVTVNGTGCSIEGTAKISKLYVFTKDYTCSAPCTSVFYKGLLNADVTVSVPSTLPAGEKLIATAMVNNAEAKDGYTAYWTIDGVKQEEFTADLSSDSTFTFEYEYTYTYDMAVKGAVEFTIIDSGGEPEKISGVSSYNIENYPLEHYYEGDILQVVTTGYNGDRTLEWAQEHDYTDLEKVLWVNAKGYTSDTEYLIWVSIAYQRCNVFQNVGGTWQLIRSSIVATGKPGCDTPVGVYKTTYKQTGWFTPDYNCFPVVRFYEGSGYAFHSRLYQPWSRTVLQDSRIGFPISLGCVRMYDEDIKFLYDTIPSGTTVVIF